MSKENTTIINFDKEIKNSYLRYSMSVIVGRALPDVRDGLKPVHRRILFSMYKLLISYDKSYKKSARIVGDVIGKYHPHGDSAVYETIVRMAQNFVMRETLIDGQGNFGSVDGDSAAAMRYTEIRTTKFSNKLLLDEIDKNTVNFSLNYDGTEKIPDVLPAKVPNILINGSYGIAVGLATNIPPHNINEVINACISIIDNPDIAIKDIFQFIKGPDFPTGGIINGIKGIYDAYCYGKGNIQIKAKIKKIDNTIVINELPYQVNKSPLIKDIVNLIKEKEIQDINKITDESDKNGIRIVIETKKDSNIDILENNLYKKTKLQISYGINMVALSSGKPKLFNIKDIINDFIQHRYEILTKKALFNLNKAKKKMHILEAYIISIENIKDIISIIKSSNNVSNAKKLLEKQTWNINNNIFNKKIKKYKFSNIQSKSILDLRLHKLTSLEKEKIYQEYEFHILNIKKLEKILNNRAVLKEILKKELIDIKNNFSSKRKTFINNKFVEDINNEDLIEKKDLVIILSHEGYIKSQKFTDYKLQHRGGKGKIATKIKESDCINQVILSDSHNFLLCFSSKGKVFWIKAYEIPYNVARGKPIVNLLQLEKNEKITTILPIKQFIENRFIIMVTKNGLIKKTALKLFSNKRLNGIISIKLNKSDELISTAITSGNDFIMLFTNEGKSIKFHEREIRPTKRLSKGIIGIKIKKNVNIISLVIPKKDSKILSVTSNGYGKISLSSSYRITNRGGKGVISIRNSKKNGYSVGAIQIINKTEILFISSKGNLIKIDSDEIPLLGRNTQGIKLMNTPKGEKLSNITCLLLS